MMNSYADPMLMHHLLILCLLLVPCGLLPAGDSTGGGFEQSDVLAIPCPVMPEKPAQSRHSLQHNGKTYYFCCSECVADFRRDPERYTSHAPPTDSSSSVWLPGITHLLWLPLLILLGGTLIARRVGLSVFPVMTASLATFAAFAAVRCVAADRVIVLREAELLAAADMLTEHSARDYFNYALASDFGEPPVPSRPPGTDHRTQRHFYRGNDERTAALWNGGHYRTCTFVITLVDAEGRELTHGVRPAAYPLLLDVQITRSPFTAEGFWVDAIMRTMFMTDTYAPLDREAPTAMVKTPLETLEARERFRVRMPVLNGSRTAAEGTLYLCERMSHQGISGSRYHFGITYRVEVRDGALTPDSDLWMGALYRTRRVPGWRLPLAEWFSDQPIPELPGPHVTKDPTALGLPDYQSGPTR